MGKFYDARKEWIEKLISLFEENIFTIHKR